ncbi:MAG: hypothetical protein LBU18_00050 [Treponema sp.]|jgi:hypothetical protein|nr:hypothetical protein [Treponema sp.]
MNYIPSKEADFVEWSENLVAMSELHRAELNLPAAKITELKTLHIQVRALHEKCRTAEYTKVDMQEKNDKKAQLIHLEEVFTRNNLQNNDAMTDELRRAFRIPIHDNTRTPAPRPQDVPEIDIETPLPRIARIKFRAKNALRWGKPGHVHGIECLWGIMDAPPARVKDFPHSAFATRTPLELAFEEDQRGQKVYFAVRWENGTVEKGPDSDIFSVIIP